MQKSPVNTNHSNPGQETLKSTILNNEDGGNTLNRTNYHGQRIPFNGIFLTFFGTTASLSDTAGDNVYEGVDKIGGFSSSIPTDQIRIFTVNVGSSKYIVDMFHLPESGEILFETPPDYFFCVRYRPTVTSSIPFISPAGTIYGKSLFI